MTRVCVFAGSAEGARPEYAEAARALAAEIVKRGIGLVYGGGSVGLMGVLANAVLAAGGEVIGVIPRPLASRELAHPGLTEMRVVDRKPVGVVNTAGYYDPLLRLLAHAVEEGFVRRECFALLLSGATPAELLDRCAAWRAPARSMAWLDPSQT